MGRPVTHRRDNAHEWFWSQADRSGICWLWTGTKIRGQYGTVQFEGRMQTAHSVAWQLINGPIPDGMEILHDCPFGDQHACINPGHLVAGSHSENMYDRWAKFRAEHPNESMRYAPKGTHPRYEENRARYLARKYGTKESPAAYEATA